MHIYNNLWVNQIAPDVAHLYLRVVGSETKSFSVHYNTFVGSQSPEGNSSGVSLREDKSETTARPVFIFNNIFVGHDVALKNTGDLQLALRTNLFFNNRSNFQGNFADTLSISADPRFANPAAGDFYLLPGSKAIDGATDAGLTTDLDGAPRPFGPGFDIGTYEFGGTPAPDPDPDPASEPDPGPGGFSVFLPLVVK